MDIRLDRSPPNRLPTGSMGLRVDMGRFAEGRNQIRDPRQVLYERALDQTSQPADLRKDAIWCWDQPDEMGKPRGWRARESKSDQIRELDGVLDRHPQARWPTKLGRHIVAFHRLQLCEPNVDRPEKITDLVRQSLDPKNPSWNEYVKATGAFFAKDHKTLEQIARQCEGNPNEHFIRALSQSPMKTYEEAYRAGAKGRDSQIRHAPVGR